MKYSREKGEWDHLVTMQEVSLPEWEEKCLDQRNILMDAAFQPREKQSEREMDKR